MPSVNTQVLIDLSCLNGVKSFLTLFPGSNCEMRCIDQGLTNQCGNLIIKIALLTEWHRVKDHLGIYYYTNLLKAVTL